MRYPRSYLMYGIRRLCGEMAHVNQFHNDTLSVIKLLLSPRVIGYEELGIKDFIGLRAACALETGGSI